MSQSIVGDAITRIKAVCAASNGRSQYYPYGGSGYKASVTHYFESSTEISGGAVQPGSEDDLAKIVKAISRAGVPFAVKCGGHSTNPGFSSTKGIQIYLARLNDISIDLPNKLVHVGAGCLFGELYEELERHELNIVGGSGLSGVGVAGWMLGGGYSVKTSKYGLGVDNLAAVRVILPDGTVTTASETEKPDLFFAIKGGGNNYGIVSEFTLKVHKQPKGTFHALTFIFDKPEEFPIVKDIINEIIKEQDEKLNIEAAFRHYCQPGKSEPEIMLTVHAVYDGPLDNVDLYRRLTHLPLDGIGKHESRTVVPSRHYHADSFYLADLHRSYFNGTYDVSSEAPKTRTRGLPMSSDSDDRKAMVGIGQFPRGRWGNVMVDQFTLGIINEVETQAREAAKDMAKHGGTRVTIGLWPFTTTMFDKATRSAWPHEKGKPNCPIIVYFTWEDKKNDRYWVDLMKKTLGTLKQKVLTERPSSAGLPFFINTALAEATTVEDLYRGNLPELKRLRKRYDPNGLMDRTGGFRIPRE